MFFKSCAALALATGFVAAKPLPAATSAQNKRQDASNALNSLGGLTESNNRGNNRGDNFNFIDGFNNFNNQNQVIQIQEQNLQIVDNGFQKQVVEQVNQVLIVDQYQNGFNNDLNNLFRKSNFRNQQRDQSTVMLVVQEINVAVDNGRGGQFEQNVFAQSVVVANRGREATQTVMLFAQETIVAQDVLGRVGGFDNFNNQFLGGQGGVNGIGGVNFNKDAANIQTQTANIQLFGSKPSWSNVAEDPAAILGGIWQAELEDQQKVENNGGDNNLNDLIAAEVKKQLDEQQNQDNQQNQENQDEEQKKQEEEQQKQEEEQQKQEEEQQKQEEEQQKQEEEQQKQEEEQQKQAEEQQKQEEEQEKQEEEQKKQEEEQQKQAEEQKKQAEEQKK